MIGILIQLLIFALVVGVIWWVLDYLPVPEPFNKVIKMVVVVIFLIAVIYLLLGLAHIDLRI